MKDLNTQIQACTLCAKDLPHGPRPVTSFNAASRIVIIGQAPGRKVHESGIPWKDASGDLLRKWLNVDELSFYDSKQFALVPMGFCYPGKGKQGDLQPRPECAPQWHGQIFEHLKHVKLTLLIGQYAQRHYLANGGGSSLSENVEQFESFLPKYFPLPHPSPRNRFWLKKNPWFEESVIPKLQERVSSILAE